MNAHVEIATADGARSKLLALADMVDHMRDLLMLEWTLVEQSTDGQPWLDVSRSLHTANQAAVEKLDAMEALLNEVRVAAI